MKINKKYLFIILIITVVLAITCVAVYGISIEKNKNEELISKKLIAKVQKNENIIVVPIIEVNDEIIIEELSVKEELNTNEEQKNNLNNDNTSKDTSNNNITSSAKYYIKVNNLANVVTIYTKDENGEYTKPYKAMICSTGTATPQSCKYKVTTYRTYWNGLFGDVYGQYAVQIVGNILFHSVPYTKNRDYSSLEWWEYDKLGTVASLRVCKINS